MVTIYLIAARAISTVILAIFGLFFCTLTWANSILPPEVAAALARAGIPQDAVSVMVVAAPAQARSPGAASPNTTDTTNSTNTANPPNAPQALITPPTAPAPPTSATPRLTHRADTPRNPASVMKLVTTYAALNTWGPNFTWKNRVYSDGFINFGGQNANPPVPPGVLEGNLVLRGSGDPKLVDRKSVV